MNLFDNIIKQSTSNFIGTQTTPTVPSFMTQQAPQAPRTTNYVAPNMQYSQWPQNTGMWMTTTQRPINSSLPMGIPEPVMPVDTSSQIKEKFWFNDKDIEFLRLAKQKGYDSKMAFEYITKKKEQEKQEWDWYNNKSYFADQRPDEWTIEQAWKWLIRWPMTFAQNVVSWPENIIQWSMNLLEKTLWEGALNPLLNVAWSAIKWDKYKPLPTWYNDVPSTNQYTENIASNIIGAGKEALTTDKTYEQARQELTQQQYRAWKDQWIGGSLANIAGGWIQTGFNLIAPWASAWYSTLSEMPVWQYVSQWLWAITQAPIDYVTNKAGWTQETAEQLWTVANLALPVSRNKIARLKPTSTTWKFIQKNAVRTADAIINPIWAVKDIWTAVFSKNPRSVEEIAGNILQPYKWMTENLEDATAWVRRVVEETGTKTSTYDGLLTAIKNTQNKYGKMLSDSLWQITTSTKSQLFDTALTQLAKIYEWVSSSDMKATLARINELWKKNITTGLTPAEKNEVKILHTKANNLFNEKGKETGWFSSDDLRGMRRDMVSEINKEASDAGITNIADINKAYWELSDARTLAENQVANLKSYKGRTPPPTTMQKIASSIVDFPIIKQAFSDPTRAIIFALWKNIRWDKINPIEVQWRLSGFLKELKKAGAKAEEIKKIEQIMLSMKLLPEKSSANIPYTLTEQDKAIIKQSKPTNITKNGNLDNSVSTSTNNRTKSVKKPLITPKKKVITPNTIKNESKVNKPVSGDTIPEGYFKNAFWEIQKLPSNKKGWFIRIWSENPFAKNPYVSWDFSPIKDLDSDALYRAIGTKDWDNIPKKVTLYRGIKSDKDFELFSWDFLTKNRKIAENFAWKNWRVKAFKVDTDDLYWSDFWYEEVIYKPSKNK